MKRLCTWHKEDIISAQVLAATLRCWGYIHGRNLVDNDSWDAITDLLTTQPDPTDIIRMTSDINQFTLRCSQLWLTKHTQRALPFLQEISASVILVREHWITICLYLGNESSWYGCEEECTWIPGLCQEYHWYRFIWTSCGMQSHGPSKEAPSHLFDEPIKGDNFSLNQ